MRIVNYTKMDTAWLRAAIAAVKPSGVANFDIVFKNTKINGARGYAYAYGSDYHTHNGRSASNVPLITIRINTASQFPVRWSERNGYLGIATYTLEEVAIVMIAHEMRHLWQRKVPRGHRVWGARGQYSERDADAYALRMVRQYRRGELEIKVPAAKPETPKPARDRVRERFAALLKLSAKWDREARLAGNRAKKYAREVKAYLKRHGERVADLIQET